MDGGYKRFELCECYKCAPIWIINNGELCTLFDRLEFCFFCFFPFIEKSYPPLFSTMPASLQARGHRPRDCNKGLGRAKREGDKLSVLNTLGLVQCTVLREE